jgi:hypothetical protein
VVPAAAYGNSSFVVTFLPLAKAADLGGSRVRRPCEGGSAQAPNASTISASESIGRRRHAMVQPRRRVARHNQAAESMAR